MAIMTANSAEPNETPQNMGLNKDTRHKWVKYWKELQSTIFAMSVFVHKRFEVKLDFCCHEIKFKQNWYTCANINYVVYKVCQFKEDCLDKHSAC